MSKQYAVIGLGKFGFSVATTLAQAGKEVLAVDKDAEPVQEIADLVTYAARADITDSRVFASLGISNMDVVIVGISENMESSILATLQAKEAGVPLVIAKCMVMTKFFCENTGFFGRGLQLVREGDILIYIQSLLSFHEKESSHLLICSGRQLF